MAGGAEAVPVLFMNGDLFADPAHPALAHGCNCAGAMGRGIAAEFRKRFPRMFEAYRERCRDGRFDLGDVFVWSEKGPTVFNLGTQRTWRTKADLGAIRKAVGRMVELAEEKGIRRIALPRIGAGLGGLAWDEVKAILVEIGRETDVELRVFELDDPGAAKSPDRAG